MCTFEILLRNYSPSVLGFAFCPSLELEPQVRIRFAKHVRVVAKGWSLVRTVVRAPTPKGPQGKGEKKKGPMDGQSTASAGSRKLHK